MHTLKIRTIGKDSGVVLPRKLLAELGVKVGDALYATPTPDGGLHLTARDPVFARQLALATAILEQDDALLRALADRSDPEVGVGTGAATDGPVVSDGGA